MASPRRPRIGRWSSSIVLAEPVNSAGSLEVADPETAPLPVSNALFFGSVPGPAALVPVASAPPEAVPSAAFVPVATAPAEPVSLATAPRDGKLDAAGTPDCSGDLIVVSLHVQILAEWLTACCRWELVRLQPEKLRISQTMHLDPVAVNPWTPR